MNPFSDAVLFLTAQTSDYMALGAWRFLILAIFYALLGCSLILAVGNWREDPAGRTGRNVAIWAIRVLIGCMWFEGMLWKLPLFSVDNGLHYWMEQMAGRAAFAVHRDLVANLLLPAFVLVNPLIFLAELGFAASLILGLGVRLAALLANSVRAQPVARHLPATSGRSGRVVVVVHVPRNAPRFLHPRRGRTLARGRCMGAPQVSATPDRRRVAGLRSQACDLSFRCERRARARRMHVLIMTTAAAMPAFRLPETFDTPPILAR